MSISVNQNHYSNTLYSRNASRNTETSGDSKQQTQGSDYLQISQEAALAFMQPGQLSNEAAPTDNYSPDDLTTEQKQAFLSGIQSSLTVTGSDEDEDEDETTDSALSEVSEELANSDISSLSEEEISELFDEVMEAMKEERKQQSDAQAPVGGGIPPELQASGGLMPPFMFSEITDDDQTDESETDETAIPQPTTEQKTELLQQLQDGLTADETGTGASDEVLSLIESALADVDLTTATDEEISDLFDQVMSALADGDEERTADSRPLPPANRPFFVEDETETSGSEETDSAEEA